MLHSALRAAAVLLLVVTGCQFTTANLQNVHLAADAEGLQAATVFARDATVYLVGELAGAPEGTVVRSSWIAAQVAGAPADHVIDEATVTTGSSPIRFSMNAPNDGWPAGNYRVDVFLDDVLHSSYGFVIQ